MNICSFEGCTKPTRTAALCSGHYMQQWQGRELTPLRKTRTADESLEEYLSTRWELDEDTGCHVWTAGTNSRGYGRVRWPGGPYSAHRAVYEQANGPVEEGKIVLHSCDNPPCIRLSHLVVGTQEDNLRGMSARGRAGGSKFTVSDVLEIRADHASGTSIQVLADTLEVSFGCVWNIVTERTWKDV